MRREVTSPVLDLEDEVAQVLDARLRRDSRRPIAVALSGGGDSVALLLMTHDWARRAGRPLVVLTVDHGLNPISAAWTEACRARADALGLAFRVLRWTGEKPTAGLPAAARAARHRLLANAAREAGAGVVLMGHTLDDVLEARAMRRAGSSTPEPRAWAPSPSWPEGRGLFLLRPLLGLPRAALRAWLTRRGETWIEDPANADPRFARARVRAAGVEPAPAPASPDLTRLAAEVRADAAGGLQLPRAALRDPGAAAFVSMACLCASGGDRPPAPQRVRRLAARLQGAEPFTATLAGARVTATEATVRFDREAGERARGGLGPAAMNAGETTVWDGRFEVTAEEDGAVRAVAGAAARLRKPEREALKDLPAAARKALPVFEDASGVRLAVARPLAHVRLLAACGTIDREP